MPSAFVQSVMSCYRQASFNLFLFTWNVVVISVLKRPVVLPRSWRIIWKIGRTLKSNFWCCFTWYCECFELRTEHARALYFNLE